MGDPVSEVGVGLKIGGLLLAALLGPSIAGGQDGEAAEQPPEKTFIVREYRYEPTIASETDQDIGLSLCGTRCNALSGGFGSYIKPRGWRLIKSEGNVERTVALDNPYLKGNCVCVGDEYRIDWYDPVTPENRAEAAAERSRGKGERSNFEAEK
jgi:hypothetical protein